MSVMGYSKTGMRGALVALCTLALCVVPIRAQDGSAPPPPQQGGGAQGMGRPGQMQERQLERMTKELNLTPDQVTQLKDIQADTRKQMMALREDASTAPEDRRDKMMTIRKGSMDKIRSMLTEDQKTKFDAMQSQMMGRGQQRGGNESGPPPASPQ